MPRLIRKAVEGTAAESRAAELESGVDVVGSIAIVRLEGLDSSLKRAVAEGILAEVRNVKGVFEQEGGIEGEFRLRRLRHLAGDKSTVTTHRENGCQFRVDVANCYFSPRLSTERLRVAGSVSPAERVLNMFAGVGPFSILIAKARKARVVSNELNPAAYEFHLQNERLNKVEQLIEARNLDAHDLPSQLDGKFDRILMPHPSQADRYLADALELASPDGKIQYYRQVPGADDKEAEANLREELSAGLPRSAKVAVRKVRAVGPRWNEMAAEIRLTA